MADSEIRRRRRPAVSCALCRRRKIRCNREQPCNNCLRARKDAVCVYEDLPPLPQLQQSESQHGRVVLPTSYPTEPEAVAAPLQPSPTTLPGQFAEMHPPFDMDASLGKPAFTDEVCVGPETALSDSCIRRALRRQIRKLEAQLRAVRRNQQPRHQGAPASAGVSTTAVATSPSSRLTQPEQSSPSLSHEADTGTDVDADSPLSPVSPPLDTPATSQNLVRSAAGWTRPVICDSFAGQGHSYTRCQGIPGYAQFTSRNVMHKTRLLGQSHGVNSVMGFRDIFESIELSIVGNKQSKVFVDMHRIKHLARIIKAQRRSPWPVTLPSSLAARRRDLPPRPLADQLVQCYLRSSEGLFRVLHVPLFQKDYEAYWADAAAATGSSSAPDTAFLVQLCLVLAIGTASHPEHVRLRPNAIRWVHQALCWAAEPDFKARLTIQTLQNSVLLLLAREAVGVGTDLVWMAVGSLLRTAVYMGLHRDPLLLPKRATLLAAEMRRRLWNTILELAVNTGLCAGGPVMLSLADFDAQPPGNFDDEELLGGNGDGDGTIDLENSTENRTNLSKEGRPPDVFTQTSVAIALRKTFPLRLAIVHFLNDLEPRGSYGETLRIDKEFRAVFRALCQTLDSFQRSANSRTDGTDEKPIPHVQLALIDLLMRRPLLCLHVPFFGAAVHDLAAYAFSHRVVVDTAVKIWSTSTCTQSAHDFSPPSSAATPKGLFPPPSSPLFSDPDEIIRIAMLGPGPLRNLTAQASLLVAAEIKLKLLEDIAQDGTHLMSALTSSGLQSPLIPVRPDLMTILHSARDWSLKAVEAGEVNCKGHLFCCLVLAQIGQMRRGMTNPANAAPEIKLALAHELVRSAEESLDMCMPLIERHRAEGQARSETEARAAAADGELEGAAVEIAATPALFETASTAAAATAADAANAEASLFTRQDFDVMSDHIENWDFLMSDIQMSDLGRLGDLYNWLFSNDST
ncbi:c6 zinc finger domain containing protein [Grosmannia clavigera kw1407]|uniref:C6 zinc finger domain containing protein n=1 Tax=Grosmannia clavigera (strain kw1407 / UAMH 11150) TaxID=655863 RepID=F0XV26_GROCL|nr:c6 zinc finger domain containing protein [Grosmannia clavigera kw1407]EFW99037.1 c6 zinc finger domain containing protein [Grosmannia clavigera kw1407]